MLYMPSQFCLTFFNTFSTRDVLTHPIITGTLWLPGPGVMITLALKVQNRIVDQLVILVTLIADWKKFLMNTPGSH